MLNTELIPARSPPLAVHPLGPFHVVDSPLRALGDSIDLVGTGEPCVVPGRVLDTRGTPLPGALLDVWQASDQGFYDVQQPGTQPPGNERGLFTADDEGRFHFRTCVPSHYPIPTDGPVGDLLRATRRHPYRPAHIHFIVGAKGHLPVTTHVFVADSARSAPSTAMTTAAVWLPYGCLRQGSGHDRTARRW